MAERKQKTAILQGKYFDKKLFVVSGVLFAGIILAVTVFASPQPVVRRPASSSAPASVAQSRETFSYRGETGIDALTLLKKQARVTLDRSGMVVGINGRLADSRMREYWEFIVNGTPATVGPKEFVTEKGDTIVWKIATY